MGGMVTIFDPQGNKGEIPQERLMDAVKAGAKPAVTIKAPDGSLGDIPADRMQDAVKAGASIVPLQEQENQHPGLWHAIASDAVGFGKSILNAGPEMATGDQMHQDAAYQQKLINEGHSLPYRALMSLTPNGMRESAESGDAGGVVGHTVVPVATAASPLAAAASPLAAEALGRGVTAGARLAQDVAGHPVAKFAGKVVDVASFNRISKLYAAYQEMRGAMAPEPQYPGAKFPEVPPPELLQARSVGEGAKIARDPARGLANIPQDAQYPGAPLPATPAAEVLNPSLVSPARTLPGQVSAESIRPPARPIPARNGLLLHGEVEKPPTPEPQETPAPPNGNVQNAPKTLSGESALRQVLTAQDNASLLKIAKSRGINVTKEAQLKPGIADNLLINKIITDFSEADLAEVRNQYIENTRFRHAFGDITPEAWHTMSLKTFFPDIKITAAQLKRTAAQVGSKSVAPSEDLTSELERSVAHVKAKRQAAQ